MADHNELGKYGEQLGAEYLTANEFTILQLNWKYSYYEIDIIASKNRVLHFIEIKTRKSTRFGFPEESAGRKKMEKINKAANNYMAKHPNWNRVQYDVLSISFSENGHPEFLLIEDVYFW